MKTEKFDLPFPHLKISDVIEKDVYENLKFPELKKRENTRSGWDLFKGEKLWDEFFAKKPWYYLKETLESREFISSILEQFEQEILKDSRINNPLNYKIIDFIENPAQQQRMYLTSKQKSKEPNEYFLRFDLQASDGSTLRVPHVDHCRRIVGGVMFLCDSNEEGIHGGEFALWKDLKFANNRKPMECEMVKKLPIRHNTMYIFLNNNMAFHAPNPMTECIGMRKWIYFSISMKMNVWPFEGENYTLKERLKDHAKVALYYVRNVLKV